MSETQTPAKVSKEDRFTEYVPFGAADKIKLSIHIVRELIANPTKSGAKPSDRDCLRFIAMCQAKRLNPFESDAYLLGYDGKNGPEFSLITAHQTYLKRAEINPEYDGMKSGVIVRTDDGLITDIEGDFHTEDQILVGGWAAVFFKTRKVPMSKRVKLSRFKKSYGIWLDDPAGMICKCAEADALRSAFPTMLGGLYMREEISFLSNGSTTQVMEPKFDASSRPEPKLFATPTQPEADTLDDAQPKSA